MKKLDWKETAEHVGIAAIVASLIFVGLQMRQTHEIALATLYQMRSDAAREIRLAALDPVLYDESLKKLLNGEHLTEHEIGRISIMNGAIFSHFENSHYLYQLGFVPEEQWASDKRLITELLRDPVLAGYWEANRGTYRESFAAQIDSLIDNAN